MDTTNMIEITDADPIAVIKEAYALSVPQGLGVLHAKDGPLPDSEAQAILDRESPTGNILFSMDYVHGRAVKLTAFKDGDKSYIRDSWFDHTDAHLADLLFCLGLKSKTPA